MNNTDWYWEYDQWVPGSSVIEYNGPWDDDRQPQFIDTEFWIQDVKIAYSPLTAGKYQRLAIIGEAQEMVPLTMLFEFELFQDDPSGGVIWNLNTINNATREVRQLVAEFFGMPVYRYRRDWCDDVGCTLSGLSLDRGISHWGAIDMSFYVGIPPTDEQKAERAEFLPAAVAEGVILLED